MLILLPNPFLDSSAEAYSNMYNKLHINEWKSIQPGLYIMHAETINCGKIEPCNKAVQYLDKMIVLQHSGTHFQGLP